MIENPFLTYGYETPDYFCDRKSETAELIKLLVNENNTALISPRRMGKTGLIQHCFIQPEIQERFYTFIVDIYSTKNLKDFVFQLGYSIVRKLKPKGQKAIDKFLQFVTSLRTGISLDGRGNASWNIQIGDIKTPDFTLEEIFNYLQSADKRCIVAIDEFQSINNYPEHNTEALLRTYVQQCRNATFIFSGSQQSMMSEMFTSPSRPFYQSISLMFLKPIPLSEYELFAKRHFKTSNRDIEDGTVELIYNHFDGVTWYIQKMLNQLFSNTGIGMTSFQTDVEKAKDMIIGQNEEAYKDTLYQLTVAQRDLLVAICKERKAEHITAMKFIQKHNLQSASSVQKAAAVLLSKQLITQYQGIYEAYDKFMSEWISKK